MALKPETQGSVLQKLKDAINEWRGLPNDAVREALEEKIADIAQRIDFVKGTGLESPIPEYSNVDNMLDIKTTSHALDRMYENGRDWLDRAKSATTREEVQKVLEEPPFDYKPPPGEIDNLHRDWLKEWYKHHPPLDAEVGGSTDSSSDIDDILGGGRRPPAPSIPDAPQLPQEPVKVGGEGGGEVEIDFGKLKGGRAKPPPAQVEPPQIEPPPVQPASVEPPPVQPASVEPPPVQPASVEPPPVQPPRADQRGNADEEIGADDITPGRGTQVPDHLRNPPASPPPGELPQAPPPGELPPAGPPDPPWGPHEPPPQPPGPPWPPGSPPLTPTGDSSFPSVPLAPLAPIVAAGGKEVVKAAGKEIITKVIGVVVVIAVTVGGTKLIVDQMTGGSTESGTASVTSPATDPATAATPATATGPATPTTSAAPGKFSGIYNVSERDRSGNCPEGTPFRKALAAGQSGPNYNYNVRVTTGGGRVSFSRTSGGTAIFSANLAADDSFEGDSGGEYPVTGKFKGSSGPGTSFDLTWTVRYGAGSCTTDLFGQFTSG